MLTSAALVLSAAALASAGVAHPRSFGDSKSQHLKRSNTVTAASTLSGKSFDYVIVGVSSRLLGAFVLAPVPLFSVDIRRWRCPRPRSGRRGRGGGRCLSSAKTKTPTHRLAS